MDFQNEETQAYFDSETGEVLVVFDEDLRTAECEDDQSDCPE